MTTPDGSNLLQCPHCGHFTGPLSRCSHCGHRLGKRLKLRTLRSAALFAALGGLFLLHLYALQSEIPLIRIADIKPTMNFAFIRIQGTVKQDAKLTKSGGMFVPMEDGSGTISVFLGKPQTEDLTRAGIFPHAGDRIIVAGTLNVDADRDITLRVQSAGQVEIEPMEVSKIAVSEIYSLKDHVPAQVEAEVGTVTPPPEGSRAPWTVEIKDDSGSICVVFWQDVFEKLENKLQLRSGSAIRVRGIVTSYKGRKQLSVSRAEDIELSEGRQVVSKVVPTNALPTSVTELKISDITADQKGAEVTVSGRVSKYWKPRPDSRAPYKIILSDGSGELECVYWSRTADALSGNEPQIGDQLEITGRLDVYKGKVQLKVWDAADIRKISKTASSISREPIKIGSITKKMGKQVIMVDGILKEPKSIPGGVIYSLSDDTGTIRLLFLDKNVPGEDRNALDTGTRVRVIAPVMIYKGVLELVPANTQAVKILEQEK